MINKKSRIYFLCFIIILSFIRADEYSYLLNKFKNAKKAVIADTKVGDILSNKNCADEWDHIAIYICRCCIVRAADKIHYDQRNGTEILEACKKEGLCTDELIQQLRKEENLENVSDTEFVNLMYDRSRVIKNVALDPHSQLYKTGLFSEESLKQFLEIAYDDHMLLDPAFKQVACLKSYSLKGQGGATTGQLFEIISLCNGSRTEFIMKEILNEKDEIFGLSMAAHYKPLKPYIYPNSTQDFPILDMPIAYLHYVSAGEKNHYLSLLPKANGIEFLQLMTYYIKNPDEINKNKLIKAYEAVGKTLGNFHRIFMRNNEGNLNQSSLKGKTILQGDFHPRNYFVDEDGNVYWIDNVEMEKFILNPQPIYPDLSWLLFLPFIHHFSGLPLDIRNNPQEWFKTFYPAFFKAYLDAWGTDQKKYAKELKEVLAYPDERTKSFWIYNKDKNLAQYCADIIDELTKELDF